MLKIKDTLYNYYVRRDKRIQYEYERYVREHMEEHRLNRFNHWRLLFKLNRFYRKNEGPYIYWDRETEKKQNIINDNIITQAKESISKKSNLTKNKPMVSPYFFMKSLLEYDIISFDVFDTLIFRPILNPSDMFILLQKSNNLMGFENIRKNAAKRALEYSKLFKGNSEITIEDIYIEIERNTGILQAEGIKNEFELEKELCFPNPYMLQVFKLLKGQGKKIIATSDMYFSGKYIRELLDNCGYFGFDEIFVSCDYNTGKEKDLFTIVKSRYKEYKLVHIGDNKKKDIDGAEKKGIKGILYPNVNENGVAFGRGMNGIVRSVYEGIVNTSLVNGIKNNSLQYEYGFKYGGICVLGYCSWIAKKARETNIDKILFVSRDGYILNKIYKDFFYNFDSKYVYWSRMAGLRLAPEFDKDSFFQNTLRRRKNDFNKCSVETWLKIMELGFLSNELSKYNLHNDDPIVPDNILTIENLLNDNWESIVSLYRQKGIAAKKYWKKEIADSKRILLVDIGWQGQSMSLLKWLIEKKWKLGCDVTIAMFGSCCANDTDNQMSLLDGSISTYAFSKSFNSNIYEIFKTGNKGRIKSIFEIFFQAPYPSFVSYNMSQDNKIEFRFAVPEVENYSYITEIHNGIYDFCKIYCKLFEKRQYMYNIDGADALIPFLKIVNDRKYMEQVLGKMIFPLDTFSYENDLSFYKYSTFV